MATGGVLEIDEKFIKQIEKADEAIQKVSDTSNSMSSNVISWMKKINTEGVIPFYNHLKKLEEQYIATSATFGQMGSKYKKFAEEAAAAADAVNKLSEALSKSDSFAAAKRDEKAEKKAFYRDWGQKQQYEAWLEQKHREKREHERAEEAKRKSTQRTIAEQQSVLQQREKKNQETLAREQSAEDKRYRDWLEQKHREKLEHERTEEAKTKATKRNIERQTAIFEQQAKKQAELRKRAEEAANRDSQMRSFRYSKTQTYGDTSKQATAAYNRLYSDRGVQSLNNMNKVLHQLQDAQNKLNLRTDEGKRKYDELGKKIQKIQGDINKATGANDRFGRSQSRLLNTTDQLQRKLALLFSVSAISGYMNKLVAIRKEFELQHKSLGILLRDSDEADKIWNQTIALAVKSPFRVKELVTYTKQLAAYRIETDLLHDTTKRLADVSAGLGVDMSRLILAYGQVRAASFLRGTELRQFTEAGIPMLDELAEHFEKVKGKAVSVGDVFEMISKRKVSFEDVAAVFKKMTDEGGVFYRMQEEQSKTLHGMISNLHDSIDLMLNDIGQSNDGIMKGGVEVAKSLVDNWRAFAAVLKMVGSSMLMLQFFQFVSGWHAVTQSGAAAAAAMNGAAGAAARLRLSLKVLANTIKENPLLMFIGLLSSAVWAIYEYNDAVKAKNKVYDEESARNIRKIDELEKIQKQVEQNNKTLLDNKKILEDSASSEEDSTRATKENTVVTKENQTILAKLKKEFPDIFLAISQQEDGTLNLNKAIAEQNKILEQNIALQQRAKGGWFTDDMATNYKELVESQAKMTGSLHDLKSAVIDSQILLKNSKGVLTEQQYKAVEKHLKQLKQVTSYEDALGKISFDYLAVDAYGRQYQKIHDILYGTLSVWGDLNENQKTFSKDSNNLWDNVKKEMPIIKASLSEITGDWSYQLRGKRVDEILDQFGIADEKIRKKLKDNIKTELSKEKIYIDYGWQWLFKDDSNQEFAEWQKKYNEFVKALNNQNVDTVTNIEQTREDLRKSIKDRISEEKNIIKAYKVKGQDAYTEEEFKEAKNNVDDLTKAYVWLGGSIDDLNKKDKNKDAIDILNNRIRLVKEIHEEYKRLRETFSHEEAANKVTKSYEDTFTQAFKGTGVEFSPFFDDINKVIEVLKKLSPIAKKEGKEAELALSKAISGFEVQLGVEVKTGKDTDLKSLVEGMFSDYELSLDLEKLDFPPDLAKQLFNLDTMDLESLRKNIEKLRPQFVGKNMEKEYEEYMKKVSEMEDKAQLERLKKYSNYLVKGMNERVKLKYEEAKQLAKIESLNYTPEQEKIIKDAVREETQKKMDKLDWEDFKNSSMYIQLFEDLNLVSTKTLNALRTKLLEMKSELKNLDPSDLKVMVQEIDKLEDVLVKRNPYKSAFLGVNEYIKAVKESKRLETELLQKQNAIANMKEREGSLQSQLDAEEKKLLLMQQSSETSLEDRNAQALKVNALKVQIDLLTQQLILQGKSAEEIEALLGKYKETRKTFTGSWSDIGSDISNAASALPQMAADVEKVFGAMDAGTRDTIESISEIGSGVGSAIQGIASQNYIQAAAGVLQVIGGIAAIGDKKKERQIQREKEKVEELQRAYEKLEEVISYSYNIDEINSNYEAAKKNLEAQIKSTQEMRRLEEDKKKTDQAKIKEYTQQIEDYQKQLQELEDERINQLGGIAGGDAIKDAAESFVNAWIDAFRETGDGLSGLEEQFDEVFMNLVKKQVLVRGVDKLLKPLWDSFDEMLNDGVMDDQDFADLFELWHGLFPQLDDYFTKVINGLGIADDITKNTGELSGLQSGIQGITEDQADILAAYWSSVRFIVSNIEQKFTDYARQMLGTDLRANPILNELKAQTSLLDEINDKLGSVIGFTGGAHIKTNLIS